MANFDCQSFMASVRREAGERGGNVPDWRTLSALFRLEGPDFIAAAYRSILKRDADRAGLSAYAAKSESLLGKTLMTASLLLSPERLLMPAWARRALTVCRQCLRRSRKGES